MNSSIGEEHSMIVITFPPQIENSYRPFLLKEELIQLATNFAEISVGIREERDSRKTQIISPGRKCQGDSKSLDKRSLCGYREIGENLSGGRICDE